jgi:hypothetical protein
VISEKGIASRETFEVPFTEEVAGLYDDAMFAETVTWDTDAIEVEREKTKQEELKVKHEELKVKEKEIHVESLKLRLELAKLGGTQL